MQKDRHGFLFPIINSVICVECGKCERTCPVVNPAEEQFLAECYAARSKNMDFRKQSSSGGIFGVLASSVLEKKGVVYGYKKIERGVVNGYTKIEDKFVDAYLTKDGETVEEAKARLKNKK